MHFLLHFNKIIDFLECSLSIDINQLIETLIPNNLLSLGHLIRLNNILHRGFGLFKLSYLRLQVMILFIKLIFILQQLNIPSFLNLKLLVHLNLFF